MDVPRTFFCSDDPRASMSQVCVRSTSYGVRMDPPTIGGPPSSNLTRYVQLYYIIVTKLLLLLGRSVESS